jgi:hypothetical protein
VCGGQIFTARFRWRAFAASHAGLKIGIRYYFWEFDPSAAFAALLHSWQKGLAFHAKLQT